MEKILIAIVDDGTGNVGSLVNMLHKIGQESALASTPDVLDRADAILLPGVGAFDRGMGNLQASGLMETLTRRVRALRRWPPEVSSCFTANVGRC